MLWPNLMTISINLIPIPADSRFHIKSRRITTKVVVEMWSSRTINEDFDYQWIIVCRIYQRITQCIINVLHSRTATLSMSFQHFSTIFLSTTAGCWGWGGCWCGWNASFISPIKPAPLRGYPAISSALDDGIRRGVTGDNRGLLRTRYPSKTCTLPVGNSGVGFTCKYGRSVTKKTPLWTRRERR